MGNDTPASPIAEVQGKVPSQCGADCVYHVMTRQESIRLALALVREGMDGHETQSDLSDWAVGRIFRELSRLSAAQDDSEELLEGFVRIAAAATEVVAALAADGAREGGSGC